MLVRAQSIGSLILKAVLVVVGVVFIFGVACGDLLRGDTIVNDSTPGDQQVSRPANNNSGGGNNGGTNNSSGPSGQSNGNTTSGTSGDNNTRVAPPRTNGSSTSTDGNQGSGFVCPGDHELHDPSKTNSRPEPYLMQAGCIAKGDVEVSNTKTGNYAAAHNSDGTGNLMECLQKDGCWVIAKYGANISDRTYASLYDEQTRIGCTGGKGCKSVNHWCFENGKLYSAGTGRDSKCDGKTATTNTNSDSKGNNQPTAPNNTTRGVPPRGSLDNVPLDDDLDEDCVFNILEGATAQVKAGCIISGDVLIAKTEAEVKACPKDADINTVRCSYHDNDPLTGHIVLMKEDGWVWAPWGASVHAPGVDAAKTVTAMKRNMMETGCGRKSVLPDKSTVRGCAKGVFAKAYPGKADVPAPKQ